MNNDGGIGASGKDGGEGEVVWAGARAPHLVEKGQGLKGFMGMRKLRDKRGPGDNVLGVMVDVGEYKDTLIDMAGNSIQVDEVIEEKGEGRVVVYDDLGMDLGCMSKAFGLSRGVEESIEMGRRKGTSLVGGGCERA
uniref:Uncharacterized protein n=1 Tax=Nelumbo nucifera TaxID=4432 RepID=A0A822YLC6_NELNU|nr:TPA_asm: hypothetical protein HUJ06_011744 [Nelumbo nucifera]